jgi:hypothetical protein
LVDERDIIFFTNSELLQLFHHYRDICLIITLHRDACNKICETLSVVSFIAKSNLPFLRGIFYQFLFFPAFPPLRGYFPQQSKFHGTIGKCPARDEIPS